MLGNFWKINKPVALLFDTIEQTQSRALFCFITKNHTLYIIHCEACNGIKIFLAWLLGSLTPHSHCFLQQSNDDKFDQFYIVSYPRSKRGMTIVRQYLTISSIVQNVWRKSQPCLINSSITASQDWNTKWESKLEPFYR